MTPSTVDGRVALYSGGNQQKVLLSKWMFGSPRIVLLDEPSRGVDIGARRRIHDFVVELAAGGAAVLLVSSEIEEVLGLSHRAYLMSGGRIVGEIDARNAEGRGRPVPPVRAGPGREIRSAAIAADGGRRFAMTEAAASLRRLGSHSLGPSSGVTPCWSSSRC